MIDLWQAIYDTLKGDDALSVTTSNIRRVPRRQDQINEDGIYFRCFTEVNSRVDSDEIFISNVELRCCGKEEENVGRMMQILSRKFNGHGQAGSFLDFSTEKVHCITSKPMRNDDPAWDTEIQMFVGIFPIEIEWSYK